MATVSPSQLGGMKMTTMMTTQRPLISGVLRTPVVRELRPAAARPPAPARADAFATAERDSVRRAVADGRDTDERAIDHVVDRLLRELTW